MPVSEEKKIFDYFYRNKYGNEIYNFRDLLKEAILVEFTSNNIEAERLTDTKVNRIWNSYVQEYYNDLKNNIVPIFDIIDEHAKTVKWIGITASQIEQRKKYLYELRPDLYRYIDRITDREYEALAHLICKTLGANNICLTDRGNEGGIDFLATIKFSHNAHFIFGMKGPIRIVGQCKKYAGKDNIGHMKEFAQTLNHVYNLSYRAGEILPDWFKMNAGPIVGWHIAHAGHQSGALNYAKNFGILTSSTKDIVEVICKSRYIVSFSNKLQVIKDEVSKALLTT